MVLLRAVYVKSVSENIGPNSPKIIEVLAGQQVRVVFSVLAVRLN